MPDQVRVLDERAQCGSKNHIAIVVAARAPRMETAFGDDVVINASGVVGYAANLTGTVNDRAIFTSNGSWTHLIVDANQQGLVGRFLGSPSINASGTVPETLPV